MNISYEVVDNMVKFNILPFYIPHAPLFTDQPPATLEDAYWMGRRAHMTPEEAITVAAQWALESGYGKSDKARLLNNYFGIKQYRNYPAVRDATEEYNPELQRMYMTYSDFIHYLSPFSGFIGRYMFVRENPRYGKHGYFDALSGNAIGITKTLVAAGYATDPQYLNKMSRLIYEVYASQYYQHDMDTIQQGLAPSAIPVSPLAQERELEPILDDSYYIQLARAFKAAVRFKPKTKQT